MELLVDAGAGLMIELSAEQRAVEKATEVQEELELHVAKVIVVKRAKKEELEAYRAGLEERIARARQQGDERALLWPSNQFPCCGLVNWFIRPQKGNWFIRPEK